MTVELAGIDEDDIQVQIVDNHLVITGERREDSEHKEGGYLLTERRYGTFEPSIALPAHVDPDHVKAKLRKGLLTVTIAKAADAPDRARHIEMDKG